MHSPQNFDFTKAAYSVPETASLLSLGRTSLYELVKAGHLRATKVGRRTLFLAADLAAFVSNLQQGEGR